jgi:hypothetical protein
VLLCAVNFARVYKPAAQHHLLVQVLHTAELRLRIQAFLHHFQQCSSTHSMAMSSSTDGGSSSGPGSDGENTASSADAEAIQMAFVNGVTAVLAELDSSLATGQANKLRQQQRQGPPVSMLQLLRVQRDLAQQLHLLADICWCTVEQYVTKGMYLKGTVASCVGKRIALPARPGSSSAMLWQVLQQAQGAQQAQKVTAALQEAAAEAYAEALPWPGECEGSLALQLGWAPSTWQLQNGIDGGYQLLERLYAGARALNGRQLNKFL